MKILCPRCEKTHSTRPDRLMGRFFICQNCRFIFLWERKADLLKINNPSRIQSSRLRTNGNGDSASVSPREL
jgi:transposase-like protein